MCFSVMASVHLLPPHECQECYHRSTNVAFIIVMIDVPLQTCPHPDLQPCPSGSSGMELLTVLPLGLQVNTDASSLLKQDPHGASPSTPSTQSADRLCVCFGVTVLAEKGSVLLSVCRLCFRGCCCGAAAEPGPTRVACPALTQGRPSGASRGCSMRGSTSCCRLTEGARGAAGLTWTGLSLESKCSSVSVYCKPCDGVSPPAAPQWSSTEAVNVLSAEDGTELL
ncbi:hypothetical protein F7725_009527 [Dissostichus mawsoni]|uniref:Uncharacterized protein n=1 Tax=Dissostichus mawsoni TaxID=36200 RepID=A0A7J5XMH2_DISMA|nr:hypothetical protein F7725_009527 [Dissostichus mawsoni]